MQHRIILDYFDCSNLLINLDNLKVHISKHIIRMEAAPSQQSPSAKANIFLLGTYQVGKTTIMKKIFQVQGYPNVHQIQFESPKTTGFGRVSLKKYLFDGMFLHKGQNKLSKSLTLWTQFWDTLGHEGQIIEQAGIEPLSESSGVIFVYNVTEPISLNRLQDYWIPYALACIPHRSPLMLIGTRKQNSDNSQTIDQAMNLVNEYSMDWIQLNIDSPTKSTKKIIQNLVQQVIQNKHLEVRMIDIYMEMLLHLDEDFDDDLLQEAITLLVDL